MKRMTVMVKKPASEEASDIQVYRRLLTYVTPFWVAFSASILGFLIYSLSNVAFVQLLSYIVDSIDGKDPLAGSSVGDSLSGFLSNSASLNRTIIPVAMIFIALSRGVGSFLGQYFITYVATNVVHGLRCELFDQLLKLPSSFYDKNSLGHLVAKVTYHVTQVTGAATDAVRIVFREGFTVIGYFTFLLYLNWRLTFIFFLVAPFIALLVRYAGRRFRKISQRIQNSMGDVTHVASETIQGYRVVRAFGGNNYERGRFQRVSNYNRRQTMKMAATQAINSPVIQFIVAIALAALVWLVLEPRLIVDMTAGKVIAFITTAGLLAKPIRQLANVNATIQRGLAAAKEIFDLFDEAVEEDSGNRYLHEVRGEIEFRHVSFSYNNNGPEVLKDINFVAKPGQTIALVGRSGSGKSTLASLIPRFYVPTKGEILIDHVPINDIVLENLREHIAVVTQHVTLFNDTVARNIAYGDLENASIESIREAAEKAYAIDYIDKLEDGLHTLVGDDGVLLSGGQRQRLAIARAFLKDAPILILDEATSALDSESEKYIQSALEAVGQDRTTISIAHRLSTIENADIILVMENGQIVEQGSHQELLAKQGSYAQLHSHQITDSKASLKKITPAKIDRLPLVNFPGDIGLPMWTAGNNPLVNAWYSDSLWVKLLSPFSALFQFLVKKRRNQLLRTAHQRWSSPVPIIVIGNINIGGTGKSPLVIWLAQQLVLLGYSPGIVSRGYGGARAQHPLQVTASTNPVDAGEEAVMIARRTGLPVVVDRDRNQAVQSLLMNNECDIVLSDDGLQHYAMARDLEIAVIDGSRGLGNGFCFPAGPLREPPSRLKEVDFVVVNGKSVGLKQEIAGSIYMDLIAESWINIHTMEEIGIDEWSSGKQVHAVAGIGNPKRFFDTLRGMGFEVLEHGLEDHHVFQELDLLFGDQLPVVMTEKDAVKCRLLNKELMHQEYWYLKVSVVTSDTFVDAVLEKLGKSGQTIIPAATT